jgi:hypothetical protein
MKRMTKSQAVAYMRGWRAVNRLQRAEVRGKSAGERLRNVEFMLAAGQTWPWTAEQLARREGEVRDIRERWQRLRETLLG